MLISEFAPLRNTLTRIRDASSSSRWKAPSFLYSDQVARLAGIDVAAAGYGLHFCKGDYFRTSRRLPIRTLVYPVPGDQVRHLGVHLTLDLSGQIRFGPDAEYVENPDYTVDASKSTAFHEAIRKYLPINWPVTGWPRPW